MLSRRVATVVTLVIVAAFVVVSIAPAFAATPRFAAAPALLPQHAKLSGSTPKDGSTVETAAAVTLTFNEDINPDFVTVKVVGPSGDEADGAATADRGTVTQPLTGDLAAGAHVVTYRVVSTDGHPVSGTVKFTTTAAPASASPSPSASLTPSAATPTTSVVASPAPSVTTAPASQESSGGIPAWLVVVGVVVLAALALGAAWRSIGGPKDDEQADAADLADDATAADRDGTHR